MAKVEKAVRERDTFRLQKLAENFGVSEPFPIAGLQAQLKRASMVNRILASQAPN